MTLQWYALLGELKNKTGNFEEIAHCQKDTMAEARVEFKHYQKSYAYIDRYQSVFIARFCLKVEKWAMKK